MRISRAQIIGLLATSVALAVTPAAGAEPLVPPENSAAVQYTETFPTTGGDKETDKVDNRSGASLDSAKAKRLKEQGPAGRQVAAIVMATGPGTAASTTEGGNPGSGDRAEGGRQGESGVNVGPGTGADRGSNGSSGLGEVIEQATGSSTSGEMGLLLPLLILAVLAWAVAFLWRRRSEA